MFNWLYLIWFIVKKNDAKLVGTNIVMLEQKWIPLLTLFGCSTLWFKKGI